MNEFMSLKVQVDPYRRKDQPTQCHKCQRYGHSQSGCRNPKRCVKCAGTCENTRVCVLGQGRIESPKCALCSGPHTANYRGCPKYPKNTKNSAKTAVHNTTTNQNRAHTRPTNHTQASTSHAHNTTASPASSVRQGTSYSQAVAPTRPTITVTAQAEAHTITTAQAENTITAQAEPTTSTQTETQPEEDDLSFFELFKQFQSFMKNLNLKQILKLIKTTAQNFKSAKGPMAKFEVGLSAISELMELINYE